MFGDGPREELLNKRGKTVIFWWEMDRLVEMVRWHEELKRESCISGKHRLLRESCIFGVLFKMVVNWGKEEENRGKVIKFSAGDVFEVGSGYEEDGVSR